MSWNRLIYLEVGFFLEFIFLDIVREKIQVKETKKVPKKSKNEEKFADGIVENKIDNKKVESFDELNLSRPVLKVLNKFVE